MKAEEFPRIIRHFSPSLSSIAPLWNSFVPYSIRSCLQKVKPWPRDKGGTKERRKMKGGMASSDSVQLYQPCSRGEGQRRLDLKRDEIFLESLDRFLGQSVPIDPPFIAPFIRGRAHFPILASRINDPRYRRRRERFLETVMIARRRPIFV